MKETNQRCYTKKCRHYNSLWKKSILWKWLNGKKKTAYTFNTNPIKLTKTFFQIRLKKYNIYGSIKDLKLSCNPRKKNKSGVMFSDFSLYNYALVIQTEWNCPKRRNIGQWNWLKTWQNLLPKWSPNPWKRRQQYTMGKKKKKIISFICDAGKSGQLKIKNTIRTRPCCCSVSKLSLTVLMQMTAAGKPPCAAPSPGVCPSLFPLYCDTIEQSSLLYPSPPCLQNFPLDLFISFSNSPSKEYFTLISRNWVVWSPCLHVYSRISCSTRVQKHRFFSVLPPLWSISHNCM